MATAKDEPSAKTLFNDPTLSDVIIKQTYEGKTREFYAHKAILCAQSSFFMKAFTGNFKEASATVMELHGDDPDHFKFALEFIYTQHYNHDAVNVITGKDDAFKRMQFAMGLYTVADKYEITRLMKPAANDFRSRLIYSKSDEVLKSVIKAHYRSCSVPEHETGKIIARTTIRKYHAFIKTADFKSLLATLPAFASDIALVCHAEDRFNLRVHYCECGQEFLLQGPQATRNEVVAGSCHSCKEKYVYRS